MQLSHQPQPNLSEPLWKSIPEWDGFYEVSDAGGVRSVTRIVRDTRGRAVLCWGKEIQLRKQANRYWQVTLSDEHHGRRETKSLHRLVAEAFLPNPTGLPQVNHKDGNKGNCASMNLEWTTARQNRSHAARNGLTAKGERNGGSRLTESQVRQLREEWETEIPVYVLAERYGVSRQTVANIAYRRTWQHV